MNEQPLWLRIAERLPIKWQRKIRAALQEAEYYSEWKPPQNQQHMLDSVNILDYWIGVTDCVCQSKYPIGGCLRCDLDAIKRRLETRMTVL